MGVVFQKSQRIPHLRAVQAREELRAAASTQAMSAPQSVPQNIAESAVSLFTSTLLDDNLGVNEQPSRLWTTRNEFQTSLSVSTPNLASDTASDTVESILEGINRLRFTLFGFSL